MDCSALITLLRGKQYHTDLEKNVPDTWNEIQKDPFDRSSAQLQVIKNNLKYPESFDAIEAMPTTVVRPFEQATT